MPLTNDGRLQAEKHRVPLRCTLRSTARRCLQHHCQQAPGPRSECHRLTLGSLLSRSIGGGLCRCSSRPLPELADGPIPRRIYNGNRTCIPPAIDESAPRVDRPRKKGAMHLRSGFGKYKRKLLRMVPQCRLICSTENTSGSCCEWCRNAVGSAPSPHDRP